MQVAVEHAYLLGNLTLLVPWVILFLWRKEVRVDMLATGVFFGLIMLFAEYYWWTVDWWHPQTISGTRIGIEDFLLGFTSVGIAVALYDIYLARVEILRTGIPSGFAVLPVLFIVGVLFWGFGLTSFWAVTIGMLVGILFLYSTESFPIMVGIKIGIVFTFATLAFYLPILVFSPGWLESTYDLRYLSGITISHIPIEEFIFWLLFGIIFGPFYAYWRKRILFL